jgi:hypothetical protein
MVPLWRAAAFMPCLWPDRKSSYIRSPTKQTTKQCHLLGGGQSRLLGLLYLNSNGLWRQPPFDSVGFEQCDQAGVLGSQAIYFQGLIDIGAVHLARTAVKAESSPRWMKMRPCA